MNPVNSAPDNWYICFYQERNIEVSAQSSYAARKLAEKQFKVSAKKAYMISVHLVECSGEAVETHPSELPGS